MKGRKNLDNPRREPQKQRFEMSPHQFNNSGSLPLAQRRRPFCDDNDEDDNTDSSGDKCANVGGVKYLQGLDTTATTTSGLNDSVPGSYPTSEAPP